MKSLFLVFNHSVTQAQIDDAVKSLSVDQVVEMPGHLKEIWGQIPPEQDSIGCNLEPIQKWIEESAEPSDYVLIQGDFGASWLMIHFAFRRNLIPVYSTSRREASETILPDGTVRVEHRFSHQRFRRYEPINQAVR